ncbi:MAG: VWA domain-containing protein [Gemmatimonadota bacterium]
MTDEYEPGAPAAEFPEDAERINVALRSTLDESVVVRAEWRAVEAEEIETPDGVGRSRALIRAGRRGAVWLDRPRGGFVPGRYRVTLSADGDSIHSLGFRVRPILPPATLIADSGRPRGYDIALAALGGRVESVTTQYDDDRRAAVNLIDGSPFRLRTSFGSVSCSVCGWASARDTLPQEIVLSFHGDRTATVGAVVIDTDAWQTRENPERIPRHVEVWTSTTAPDGGFTRAAAARLTRRPAEQLIPLEPTAARYVKLRILSNHGDDVTQIGEIRIIEAVDPGRSILADVARDLARPALGGVIARFTSQWSDDVGAHNLVDGNPGDGSWRSWGGYLPQEFVFAFRDDREALVDRVELSPATGRDTATWPRRVKVEASRDGPLGPFDEVGEFTIPADSGPHTLPIRRRARFLVLKLLENRGGSYTSLAAVRIVEGDEPGYESILVGAPAGAASAGGDDDDDALDPDAAVPVGGRAPPPSPAAGAETERDVDARTAATPVEAGGEESEPNDSPTQASPLPLGRHTAGAIHPPGESDYFRFASPADSGAVLTVELEGRPYIRTSVALVDPNDTVRKRFDPARATTRRATFSWAVEPGDSLLRVAQPPTSVVLVWDVSGSMEGSTADLRAAVESFLDAAPAMQRIQLMKFSDRVETLLPDFTSDSATLRSALSDAFEADGGTAFYDAVAEGLDLLDGVAGNRAIVVMTDGADANSDLEPGEYWRLLDDRGIRVYTIGLGVMLREYRSELGTRGDRLLRHTALATGGRFLFAQASEDLDRLYAGIAAELRAASEYRLRPTLAHEPGTLRVRSTGERIAGVSEPSRIELILDASGSMWGQVEGRSKIAVAREVLGGVVERLPADVEAALRVYGHRRRAGTAGACRDSELLVPFGPLDRERMLETIGSIEPLGTTPLAHSLRRVADDLDDAEGEKLVVLVTDGEEECGGDPAEAITELRDQGLAVRVNIVGFGLGDDTVKERMRRAAGITGGRFMDAANARELNDAMAEAMAVPFDVLDAGGEVVGSGLVGAEPVEVPGGRYTVVIHAASAPVRIPDTLIEPGAATVVEIEREGQEVSTQVNEPGATETS